MKEVPKKSAYLVQICMVFCFNMFILAFFSWFFYLIYSAHQLKESTGPGMGIAIVAIPIVGILLWVVNYTSCGLLTDETSRIFGHGSKETEEEEETKETPS
jgi:hypothetical protein